VNYQGHFSTKEHIMKKLLIAASIALSTSLAFADGVLKPHHGGVMAEATSGNRVELVGGTDQVTVYLTDHGGNPVDSKGVSGDITLLSGTEKSRATLTPAGDNQLVAKAKAVAGTKAIVKITLPGKSADQIRLTLK
jgi:nitrogen fixation protein FixH